MACEGLCSFPSSDIPEFSRSIASAGNEDVLAWTKGQTEKTMISAVGRTFSIILAPHHIACVIVEFHDTSTRLNVP